jgi:hypothetical protein
LTPRLRIGSGRPAPPAAADSEARRKQCCSRHGEPRESPPLLSLRPLPVRPLPPPTRSLRLGPGSGVRSDRPPPPDSDTPAAVLRLRLAGHWHANATALRQAGRRPAAGRWRPRPSPTRTSESPPLTAAATAAAAAAASGCRQCPAWRRGCCRRPGPRHHQGRGHHHNRVPRSPSPVSAQADSADSDLQLGHRDSSWRHSACQCVGGSDAPSPPPGWAGPDAAAAVVAANRVIMIIMMPGPLMLRCPMELLVNCELPVTLVSPGELPVTPVNCQSRQSAIVTVTADAARVTRLASQITKAARYS